MTNIIPVECVTQNAADDVDGVVLLVVIGVDFQNAEVPELVIDFRVEQAPAVILIKFADGFQAVVVIQTIQRQAAVITPLFRVDGVNRERIQLFNRLCAGIGREPVLPFQHAAVVVDALLTDAGDVLLHLG